MATVASTDIRQPLRVVEFYAGVGGFHFSLLKSKVKAIVVASVDINTNTNAVYKHNFPHTLHLNRNICGMTAKELDNLRPDVFLLSPPCQPFTRQGQRRDNLDRRTDSFFHLMELLAEMECPPSYLLMENVQGFEISHTRNHFTTMLHSLNFSLQEFLLSPVQFSVPNSRLRYYLLAKRAPLKFGLQGSKEGTCKPCTDPSQLLEFIKGNRTAQKCKETGLLLEKKIEAVVTCTTPAVIKPSLGSEQNLTNSTDTMGTIENTQERDLTSTQSVQPTDREVFQSDQVQPTDREVFQNDQVQPTIHTPTCTPEDTRHIDSSSKQTIDSSPIVEHPKETASKPDRLSEHPSVNLDPLSTYLEPLSDSQLTGFLVPNKILLKYAIAMDIVRPVSRRSCCFTKAYGQYTVGTGSIMQQCLGEEELAIAFEGYKKALKDGVSGSSVDERQDPLSFLRPLKLRYFTPREVANLMSFPPSFSFPPSLSRTQCYKVIGNSLNVSVVASLMQYLFCDVQYCSG